MPLYDIATQLTDATARLEELRKERDDAQAEIHSLGRIDQLRTRVGSNGNERARVSTLEAECDRIDREMRGLKRRIRELKSILGGRGSKVTFESVFVRLAEVELPPDIFRALSAKASSITAQSKGHK